MKKADQDRNAEYPDRLVRRDERRETGTNDIRNLLPGQWIVSCAVGDAVPLYASDLRIAKQPCRKINRQHHPGNSDCIEDGAPAIIWFDQNDGNRGIDRPEHLGEQQECQSEAGNIILAGRAGQLQPQHAFDCLLKRKQQRHNGYKDFLRVPDMPEKCDADDGGCCSHGKACSCRKTQDYSSSLPICFCEQRSLPCIRQTRVKTLVPQSFRRVIDIPAMFHWRTGTKPDQGRPGDGWTSTRHAVSRIANDFCIGHERCLSLDRK